jgi:hypothetical protein
LAKRDPIYINYTIEGSGCDDSGAKILMIAQIVEILVITKENKLKLLYLFVSLSKIGLNSRVYISVILVSNAHWPKVLLNIRPTP